ncbi:ATP synthase coupling factor 6, putative [Pediculus humanus corporis]|uniref:ATP synthase coupling factor 6, putative n=1 Tax=Pediculus humanus subsp. corporis TaxID=121224 RepID=E0VSJ9_PEDHC|nr:ATP synthase coupling factor 6, putative [Pediculus humanus corporis]EEB16355.1 ATP synthase coupling factor 6, putative [Pediculus humanus corporis]
MQSPVTRLVRKSYYLCKRDLGIFVPFLQKANDPIQQLFVDKIREFKAKSSSGQLVDPSPELQKELQSDRDRLMKQFGMKSAEEAKQFPNFKFTDPPLQPYDITSK